MNIGQNRPILTVISETGRTVLKIERLAETEGARNQSRSDNLEPTYDFRFDDYATALVQVLAGGSIADGTQHPVERHRIIRCLVRMLHIDQQQANSWLGQVLSDLRFKKPEFACRESAETLSRLLSRQQKTKVLEELWDLTEADGVVDPREEEFNHWVARTLGIHRVLRDRIMLERRTMYT